MRKLIVFGLVLCAACSDAVGVDEKHVPPPEQPFDSVAWNCTPGDSVVNGQVLLRCSDP